MKHVTQKQAQVDMVLSYVGSRYLGACVLYTNNREVSYPRKYITSLQQFGIGRPIISGTAKSASSSSPMMGFGRLVVSLLWPSVFKHHLI